MKNENELIENNIQQSFSDDGMMEMTMNRSDGMIEKLVTELEGFGAPFNISRGFKMESRQIKGKVAPIVLFQGEEVNIKFLVTPKDKYGNEGKSYLTKEEYDKLRYKVEKENPDLIMEIVEERTEIEIDGKKEAVKEKVMKVKENESTNKD